MGQISRDAGAARMMSVCVDRRIHQQAKEKPQAIYTCFLQHGQDNFDAPILISIWSDAPISISHRLIVNGQTSWSPLKRSLSLRHIHKRLHCCRDTAIWATEWHKVVFSNESYFSFSSDSRRVRMWHRRGQRFNPAAIVEHLAVRQCGIMVWAHLCTIPSHLQFIFRALWWPNDTWKMCCGQWHSLNFGGGVLTLSALYQHENARL